MRARLRAVPSVELENSAAVLQLVDDEVAYLASDEALAAIAVDGYWPKWDSPWWSMLLLWELGYASRIPRRTADAHAARIAKMLHFFPLRDEEYPAGTTVMDACCHCQLGSVDQVLTACGVDVDAQLPWIREWFARYQMSDGGLNCHEAHYLVPNEIASSMVGTVPGFEAMRRHGPSVFSERAAAFMIERELRRGSHTHANAEERESAAHWAELTFPRFYLYDTLRGLTALVRWATQHGRSLPRAAIEHVVDDLCTRYPDGVVRIGRRAFTEHNQTRDPLLPVDAPRRPARTRPLLDAVSRLGDASPTLTREWTSTRAELVALLDGGRIIR